MALWKIQRTWSSIALRRALGREPRAIASAATTNLQPCFDTGRRRLLEHKIEARQQAGGTDISV